MTRDELKKIQTAKQQVLNGQMTIWNTRLDALVEAGDIRGALDQLVSPVEDAINNCGCNVQCGAMQGGIDAITNPVRG